MTPACAVLAAMAKAAFVMTYASWKVFIVEVEIFRKFHLIAVLEVRRAEAGTAVDKVRRTLPTVAAGVLCTGTCTRPEIGFQACLISSQIERSRGVRSKATLVEAAGRRDTCHTTRRETPSLEVRNSIRNYTKVSLTLQGSDFGLNRAKGWRITSPTWSLQYWD
eukprot:5976809-Pleurochrysis_carterae.AAC.1